VSALGLSTVVPVADLPAAVATWTALLGVEPTFVDGDRWAQFDVGGGRLALSGEGVPDLPGVMVKVDDLEDACRRARAEGLEVGEMAEGAHERRCVVRDQQGWPVVLYAKVPGEPLGSRGLGLAAAGVK